MEQQSMKIIILLVLCIAKNPISPWDWHVLSDSSFCAASSMAPLYE